MNIKTNCNKCGEELLLEPSDLKVRVWKKKGEIYNRCIHNGYDESLIREKGGVYEHKNKYKKFRLLKDIKLKTFICPICDSVVFLNTPNLYYDCDFSKFEFSYICKNKF